MTLNQIFSAQRDPAGIHGPHRPSIPHCCASMTWLMQHLLTACQARYDDVPDTVSDTDVHLHAAGIYISDPSPFGVRAAPHGLERQHCGDWSPQCNRSQCGLLQCFLEVSSSVRKYRRQGLVPAASENIPVTAWASPTRNGHPASTNSASSQIQTTISEPIASARTLRTRSTP